MNKTINITAQTEGGRGATAGIRRAGRRDGYGAAAGNRRAGKPWSGADISRLVVMAERRTSVDRIARKLGRSESAIRTEAAKRRLKLSPAPTPTDKRPYGGTSPARARRAADRAASRNPTDRKAAARHADPSVPAGDTLF
ncbi:MAG: hypothetical protein WAO61_04400 [Solirubrobacterales bacterium]